MRPACWRERWWQDMNQILDLCLCYYHPEKRPGDVSGETAVSDQLQSPDSLHRPLVVRRVAFDVTAICEYVDAYRCCCDDGPASSRWAKRVCRSYQTTVNRLSIWR